MNDGSVERLLDQLREIVGAAHVLTDADARAGYEVDWTGRFRGVSPAVVRPGSTAEVAAVVRACGVAGASVVTQGGNTGLVGGAVPAGGELVVSTRRLDWIGPVDAIGAQVSAGAGATLAAAQAQAAAAGLAVGIDLGARDSATVGGMVATNAAGLNYLRHGGMRRQLVGLQAVLANGEVIGRLDALAKDNTGYDLAGLLCGSEGTLAIVTAVRLQLVAPPRHLRTALAGVPDLRTAVLAVASLRDAGVVVEAAEAFLDEGMALVCRHLAVERPLPPSPAYLLVDWDGDVEALATTALGDALVADDPSRRAALWRFREAHTEAVNRAGVPHKLDVSVAPADLDALVAALRPLVAATAPGALLVVFGHVADGNLHVNVVGPPPDDDTIDDAILRLVAEMGGSISAEHGIGTAKRRWLSLVRPPAELAAMRAVKQALDPGGLLNPSVLF
ncbi:MAG: FAD-binding oxidoreductase [Acidobacteria bacterium]|nr:FAD-binding oxidoreductase [Acidobacteriota bacterium]